MCWKPYHIFLEVITLGIGSSGISLQETQLWGQGETHWWITDGASTTATYNMIPGKSDASGAKDMA